MSALGAVTEVEIRSEPAVWLATSGRLAESAAAMAQTVAAASSVVFLGCGSSHFGGRLGAELLRRANIPAAAYVSSDYVLRPPVEHGTRPVAVALSRSGETSETLQAISSFRRRHGGHVYGLVCRPESEIARAVDVAVAIPEADERAVPQTRSVSAFLLFSMLLGATLGGRDILADIARVASEVEVRQASIWSSARIAATASRYVLLGSGSGFALAQEGALKFTEMGRAPAWAYRALEYRHGPIEALDAETTVVGLLGDDPDEAECDAFTEASARAGSVVDMDVIGPHVTGPSSLLGQLYVLQTLALEAARFRALDADQPPNIRAFVSGVWLDPT